MSNKFNIFLPVNHAEEEGLANSQFEWRTRQEHSGCDLSVQENFCHKQFMVFGRRRIPLTSRTIAMVTNILKELSKLYQHEVSRVNLGLKNPGVEYLLLNGITG